MCDVCGLGIDLIDELGDVVYCFDDLIEFGFGGVVVGYVFL